MKTLLIYSSMVGLALVMGLDAAQELQKGETTLYPLSLEVGKKGRFLGFGQPVRDGEGYYAFVEQVLSETEVLIKAGGMEPTGPKGLMREGPPRAWFILQTPTKGLADGRAMDLTGVWEVTGTRKIEKRTVYVVKRLSDK